MPVVLDLKKGRQAKEHVLQCACRFSSMPQYQFLFAYIAVDLPHMIDVPERHHIPILVNHRARLIRGYRRLTGQLVMYSLLVCKLKGKWK